LHRDSIISLWWHINPDALSKKVKKLIEDPTCYEEMLLSAISPWEFCKLIEKGRLGISCDTEEWLGCALNMPKLRVIPLTTHIAYNSTVLPKPCHNDPADQIIVASAREEKAILLTKDEKIRSYKGVKSLW
jgi:PIN domain nuclease of toxin-antitoxin system